MFSLTMPTDAPLAPGFLLLALALGYLLGSIPFGLVLTRLAGMGDIRAIGSGNIGATNVLRTGNRKLAAATLLGDALKGTLAVVIAAAWGPLAAMAAALGAFLGHVFPVWLKFRGGKGVATFLGCLIGLDWRLAIVFAVVWLAIAYLSRYSSLSALVASIAVPLMAWLLFGNPLLGLFLLTLAALLWWKHAENIRRLLAGSEGKIGAKA